MITEQADMIIELLKEMRDELFRQGHAHTTDHYDRPVIRTLEIE